MNKSIVLGVWARKSILQDRRQKVKFQQEIQHNLRQRTFEIGLRFVALISDSANLRSEFKFCCAVLFAIRH